MFLRNGADFPDRSGFHRLAETGKLSRRFRNGPGHWRAKARRGLKSAPRLKLWNCRDA